MALRKDQMSLLYKLCPQYNSICEELTILARSYADTLETLILHDCFDRGDDEDIAATNDCKDFATLIWRQPHGFVQFRNSACRLRVLYCPGRGPDWLGDWATSNEVRLEERLRTPSQQNSWDISKDADGNMLSVWRAKTKLLTIDSWKMTNGAPK